MFSDDLGLVDFVVEWDQTHVAFFTQADLVDCVAYTKKLNGMVRAYSAEKVKIFVYKSERTSYFNAFEEFVNKGLRHIFTPIRHVRALPVLLKEMVCTCTFLIL